MSRAAADALSVATRLLAAGDKTRAQLEQRLRARGFPQAELDAALSRAAELGYLDDARVAARRARAELVAGWAGEALLHRLTAKGLEEGLARAAIAEAVAELGWAPLDAARALVQARKVTGLKAARLLASRGFAEDVVERLVRLPGE